MAVIDGLRSSELFARLDTQRLETIAGLCRDRHFRKDETIFIEGEEATDLFILRSGMVVLEMAMQPLPERPVVPIPLETITPGECLGWSALVEPHEYTLTARCMAHSSVLALLGTRMRELMATDPELGRDVMAAVSRVVGRRLADTRLRLTSGVGLILQQQELVAPS